MSIDGFNYKKLATEMEKAGIINIPFLQMNKDQVDVVVETVRRSLPEGEWGLDIVPF